MLQRRSAAIVGVADVEFWDFPDGELRDNDELRAKIGTVIATTQPDIVVTIFGGPEWAPGAPNQRDHIEFAAAVRAVCKDRRLFDNGPNGTRAETVDDFIDVAVDSLAAHAKYLSALHPDTPVAKQARRQVDMTTPLHADFDGRRIVEFVLEGSA